MNPEKIQSNIDALLTYMNDDMESLGETIKTVYFGFNEGENDRVAIDKNLGWPEEHLFKIINISHSRGLVIKTIGIFHRFNSLKRGKAELSPSNMVKIVHMS